MQQSTSSHRPPSRLKTSLTIVILFLFGAVANATTYTVNSLADPTDPGFITLRDAINLATSPGDLINFSVIGTINLLSTLPTITNSDLTIDGGNNIQVDGGGSVQIMVVAPGAGLMLENITIQNGSKAAGNGGGIDNSGDLTIINSTFSGNSAQVDGGGINNNINGTVVISGSTISGNSVPITGFGGGINNFGTMTINFSTISGNSVTSTAGGGINNFGTMTINYSTISGNSASGPSANAAGINNGGPAFFGTLIISNSTFSNNSASGAGNGAAGGIKNAGGTVTISNSTFSGNSASGEGGGIDNVDGSMTIINSTFSGNSSATVGGGIFNRDILTLQNTIVANSPSGGDCSGPSPITADSSNMADDSSCGGARQVTLAALNLGPLQNNGGPTDTIALEPGSIAIGAGFPPYAVSAGLIFDQRGPGFPRYNNGTVDVGAYESQAPLPLLKSFSPKVINFGAQSTLTITFNFSGGGTLSSPFIDTLPSNLTIVGNAVTDCGGTLTNDASSITLTSGSIPAISGTCSITATVQSSIPGTYVNNIPAGTVAINDIPILFDVRALLSVARLCP